MSSTRPNKLGGMVAVSDSTALAELDASGFPPGTEVYNADVGSPFALTTSTAALDPDVVVAVKDTTGARWILVEGGGGFTGTPGSVPFVGEDGSLTEDHDNFNYDAENEALNLAGGDADDTEALVVGNGKRIRLTGEVPGGIVWTVHNLMTGISADNAWAGSGFVNAEDRRGDVYMTSSNYTGVNESAPSSLTLTTGTQEEPELSGPIILSPHQVRTLIVDDAGSELENGSLSITDLAAGGYVRAAPTTGLLTAEGTPTTKTAGVGSGELTLTGTGTVYEPRYAADGTTILGWVALLQATVNP